jgi:hypothetical protein
MKRGDIWENFQWPVMRGGYRWVSTKCGPALVPCSGGNADVRHYRPFSKENRGLFRIFAETPRTLEGVLGFANQYGLLGGPVSRMISGGDPTVAADELSPTLAATWAERGDFAGEMFEAIPSERGSESENWNWTTQIVLMQGLLTAYEAPSPEHPVQFNYRNFLGRSGSTLVSPEQQLAARKVMTVTAFNMMLRGVASPCLCWSDNDDSPRLEFSPRGLVGALWLQFASAIATTKSFRLCRMCNKPIEISRSGGARTDAVFCSNACKSRDYRQRMTKARRLAQEGWSPKAVARELKTSLVTVRRWLRDR